MFAQSAKLISGFYHFISKHFIFIFTLIILIFLKSQWFVLKCSSFAYIILSFLLQNNNLCESLINSFEVPKSGKTTTTK